MVWHPAHSLPPSSCRPQGFQSSAAGSLGREPGGFALPAVPRRHVLRCSCSFPAGLLLWDGRLLPLLWLLPQGPTVSHHPLHVCTLLHPGRRAVLPHDVPHCGQGHAGACKLAFPVWVLCAGRGGQIAGQGACVPPGPCDTCLLPSGLVGGGWS